MPTLPRPPPKSVVLAVISTIIALLCAVASAVIIITSNNDNVEKWRVQPTVLLAVFSSIYNLCLAATLTTAVAICWWRAALHGTKAAPLHYIWERGMGISFFPASIFAGFNVNKVAAVTLITAIAKFSNNPLLQRSTMIQAQDSTSAETMKLHVAQILPDGWMGVQRDAGVTSYWTPPWALAARAKWWRNETISNPNEPGYLCDGTCEGFVQGTGIKYNCSTTYQTLDLSGTRNGTTVFGISSVLDTRPNGAPYIRMKSSYLTAMDNNCSATLTIDRCFVDAAIVKYPLVIQNDTITLNSLKILDMEVLSTYTSPGDFSNTTQGAGVGPLKGLYRFLDSLFFSNATANYNPTAGSIYYTGMGPYQDLFYKYEVNSSDSRHLPCPVEWKWSSPTNFLLTAMIQFLFFAAIDAGEKAIQNGTDATEIFTVNRLPEELIFRSDYKFMTGALVVMVVSIIGVFFLLWGWWDLDRPVSLSPLETAKAFDAPLMQTTSPNDVEGIIDVLGNKKIKYDGERIQHWDDASRESTPKNEQLASGNTTPHQTAKVPQHSTSPV